jgi:hypothetical protein
MGRPHGPASPEVAGVAGAYWKSLLVDRSWVRRRVETGTIIDESHVEISVSFDIDAGELSRRVPSDLVVDGRVPVPLVSLIKELQLDLDVRGAQGEVLSVATSDTDAHFSHAYLLREIADRGINLSDLSTRFVEQSHSILRSSDGLDELIEIVLAIDEYQSGSHADARRLGMSDDDADSWVTVLNDDELFELLLDLSDAYFMVAYVPADSDSSIVKYRRLTDAEIRGSRIGAMSLGLKPLSIYLNANGIGTAAREHTRVTAPPGTRVVGGTLLADGMPVPDRLYELRKDAERIVFYTSNARPADYSLRIDVVPRFVSFFLPALLCALLTLIFSGAALYLESYSERFTRSVLVDGEAVIANADASAALLALVPTLFAVFLVQGGEHRLVARLHAVPRMTLLVTALLLLLCAGCIAVSASHVTLVSVLTVTTVAAALSAFYFASVVVAAGVRRIWPAVAAFANTLRESSGAA